MRKGAFTPEQEKQLDDLVQLSGIAEAIDGPAISLADNQGIERLLDIAEEKYPGVREEIIYPLVDAIMLALPSKPE